MKKQTEIKQDSKSFERFETLLRKVVSVPKDEILRREKDAKAQKEVKKNERLDKTRF
jgi:predicted amidophosphoribosyltransferase